MKLDFLKSNEKSKTNETEVAQMRNLRAEVKYYGLLADEDKPCSRLDLVFCVSQAEQAAVQQRIQSIEQGVLDSMVMDLVGSISN